MLNMHLLLEAAALVAAAYLIGCFGGYGLRRLLHAASGRRPIKANAVPPPALPSGSSPARISPAARLARAATRDDPPAPPRPNPAHLRSQSEDLKQIRGIGPRIEASLKAMGVHRIDQIAFWTKADIERVESRLAFKGRIRRERWVEQARELVRAAA